MMAPYPEVDLPRSTFGRPRQVRETRRARLIREMLEERERGTSQLYYFKLTPGAVPDPTETRPLPKGCQYCLPQPNIVVQEEWKHLGLDDCFTPPTMSSYNTLFCRTFPIYTHYARTIKCQEMHNLPLWQNLEKDPTLFKLFQKEFAASPKTAPAKKTEILKILRELQVSSVWKYIGTFFFRVSAWLCQRYLSLYFTSVLVHRGQIEILKDVCSKKLPVIYIPTYRSDFDKVLILWALAHHGLRTPLFFRDHAQSGNKFLQYFGGIGSRLKIKAEFGSENNHCAALSVYMQQLLRRGNSLLFHVETGRTRSGNPSTNICGTELLKVIYDDFKNEKIEDAYFVPVSVSYEYLPDAQEILEGKRSARRSFLSWIISAIFPVQKPVRGAVKIDFAHPVCMRELHNEITKSVKVRRLTELEGKTDSYCVSRNCSFLRWNSSESLNSVCSIYGELAPLYPADEELDQATFLDVMNNHLLYDAGKCESVMPTHLVAFILMKKFRQGIHLKQLNRELEWLIKIVQSHKKDFGFSLTDTTMESIVFHAVDILREDIIVERQDGEESYRFVVRPELSSLRKLEYYANYLLPMFMMEGVIATAIFGMKQASVFETMKGFEMEFRIKDYDFIYHCTRVYNVLIKSFLLHAPCLKAESAIRLQIQEMNDTGKLNFVMPRTRTYQWEDDDDYYGCYDDPAEDDINDPNCPPAPEEIVISTTKPIMSHLSFYRSLVLPYLEIFAFLLPCLEVLEEREDQKMDPVALEKYLVEKLLEKLDLDFKDCGELCNRYTVKQFLAACEDNSIVEMLSVGDGMDRAYQLLKTSDELRQKSVDILHYVSV